MFEKTSTLSEKNVLSSQSLPITAAPEDAEGGEPHRCERKYCKYSFSLTDALCRLITPKDKFRSDCKYLLLYTVKCPKAWKHTCCVTENLAEKGEAMLRTQIPPSRAAPCLHFVLRLLQASATMNYITTLIFKMNN